MLASLTPAIVPPAGTAAAGSCSITMIRVYYDNNVDSGRILRDLRPPEEMTAVEMLDQFWAAGHIEILQSRFTRHQQLRTWRPDARAQLLERQGELPVVDVEGRLLGIRNGGNTRTWLAAPMIDEIVDEELFVKLVEIGLSKSSRAGRRQVVCSSCR